MKFALLLFFTAFMIPFGTFGISSASEHYLKVIKENLSDCERTVVDTDDILIHVKINNNTMKDYGRSCKGLGHECDFES